MDLATRAEHHRVVSILPKGTALSRFMMIKGIARGDSLAEKMLSEQLVDTPQISATLELLNKAAVGPGTTTDATFAAPLAQYGIAAEYIPLERGASIIGALIPKMRRAPFHAKVPAETGAGTGGAWVAQGNSIQVSKTAFNQLSQEMFKAGTIVVLSRELLKLGDPSAERIVRETTAAGVAAFLDGQFLTSTITAIADTRPAAITNGAPSVVSTGSTSAQITTDLNAMLANITTAGSALVWVMRPVTAYRIAATLGTPAADVPRSLFGIPMVLSLNSPQQITLVDGSGILYSDNDSVEIDTSDQATIQMSDTPTDPAVAATVFQSLWDNNLWGIRVQRWLAYQRAVAGSVTFMTTTY